MSRDCSQAWSNQVSNGVNYAQQAKIYLASGAAIITISSSSTGTMAAGSVSTQAHSITQITTTPLSLVTCPAGCVPISPATTTISIMPASSTTSSTQGSSAASPCPVSGGNCESGAMACDGYYYGQCANGIWVVRKCADGLACFSEYGGVYCDWASNGVITSCSGSLSSKVKRDTQEYDVPFVGGGSSSLPGGSTSLRASDGMATIASATTDSYVEITTVALDEATVDGPQSIDLTSTTTVPDTTVSDDFQVTSMPYLFNYSVSWMKGFSPFDSSTSSSTPVATASAVLSHSTNNSSSHSTISNASCSDLINPLNVSVSIQPLNNTNFVAVLKASTLNNSPILTDWSFSFKSEYRVLETDRGNLTISEDLSTYTITSIPIQEPSVNMAVVVRLWGVYDHSISDRIGYCGIENVNSGSSGNGSFSRFRRVF